MMAKDPRGTPRDGWSTSKRIAERVHALLGPVFDPCWNPWSPIVVAPGMTREQGDLPADQPDPEPWPTLGPDCMPIDWHLNPPFSATAAWLERLVAELKRSPDRSCTVVTLDDASVGWYAHHWRHASAICRPSSREHFEPPPGIDPTSFNVSICIALYSDSRRKRTQFASQFRDLGPITTQWRR